MCHWMQLTKFNLIDRLYVSETAWMVIKWPTDICVQTLMNVRMQQYVEIIVVKIPRAHMNAHVHRVIVSKTKIALVNLFYWNSLSVCLLFSTDIDECTERYVNGEYTAHCNGTSTCSNTNGSFNCLCDPSFNSGTCLCKFKLFEILSKLNRWLFLDNASLCQGDKCIDASNNTACLHGANLVNGACVRKWIFFYFERYWKWEEKHFSLVWFDLSWLLWSHQRLLSM